MVALHNSFLHFMKEEFTIEVLKEIIKERGLKYEIDDYYTAISQEHKFTDVVSDAHRNQPVHFSSDHDVLETLILKSAILWNKDYLDTFDSRFKHNWERNGLKFIVPAHISETDFTNQDTKLRIMAANIALAANKKFKCESDFEEYQKRAQKYPGRLDFSGDKMVAMSLSVFYLSKTDHHQPLKDLLEFYLQGEWSKKWMELHALPVFKKVEKNIESRFDKGLKNWVETKFDLYCYYPIAVHYNEHITAYKVAEFLIDGLNEGRELEFQKAIASVAFVEPQIKAEITELKRRYFSPYSTFDENQLYRIHREDACDAISIHEDFERIVEWSSRKAAADFIFTLEDRLAIGDSQKNTDLSLPEFANLAFFLAELDLFDSPERAVLHLSRFFRGVDANQNVIDLKYGTLKMKKDKTIIEELKKVFNKSLK